jgi:2-keto-4-pentenoate hydratase/2-oxohepta-3-ene-1,7-dioic acid hydratase in catechol pathway
MKLASVETGGRRQILAAQVDESSVIDLSAAIRTIAADVRLDTMLSLIEAGEAGIVLARQAVAAAHSTTERFPRIPLADLAWHAPVRKPGKIVCLALNNSANADRIISGPRHPATFVKPASALVGHDRAIECRPSYGRTHPEPELAFVIGRTTKNVRAVDAHEHVFGYTIHNDITSPTMRSEDTFHYRAIHPRENAPGEVEYVDTWVSYPGRYKSADTFACMGPWLVTADEIPDPHDLSVQCHHRGRMMTEDNTANLFHKVPDVVEFISAYMTLEPGDVVSMGTALQRSGNGGAVQNIDLNKLGGPVSVTIQGLGTLLNHVVHV